MFADSPTWSPTGDRLAVVTAEIERSASQMARLTGAEVVVIQMDDRSHTNITNGALPNAIQAAWSPSSEQLLVQSIQFGQSCGWDQASIHMIDATSGEIKAVDEVRGDVTMPVWSPDGSRYAFVEGARLVRIGGGPGEIWGYLPSSVSQHLTWSPDGSALLAVADEVFQPSYLIPLDDLRDVTRLSVSYDAGGMVGGPPQWAGGPVTAGQFPAPGDELNHPWLPSRNGSDPAAPAPPDPIPPRF
jgi:Tol biopolymer transport system component